MGSSSAVSTWERVKLPLQGPRFPTTKTKKGDKLKKKNKKDRRKKRKRVDNCISKKFAPRPPKIIKRRWAQEKRQFYHRSKRSRITN